MTTHQKLKQFFDDEDVNALIEMLKAWKEAPEKLLDVFISGISSLGLDDCEAKDGLRIFSANFKSAAKALDNTEDGKHFNHLRHIVDSYINLIDLKSDIPRNILN